MRVGFWGTRGSIASPGAGTCRFGGNTSCVSVTTASHDVIILDCGTGARPLGLHLLAEMPRPVQASILLTHTHWDHIQGFPFFAPAFLPGNRFDIYAPAGGELSLEETLAGQMEYTYFPVALAQLPSSIAYHDLTEGAFPIGGARIEAQHLNHPAMTLGYRIECDGVSVAYLCDHEPFAGERWRSGPPSGGLESLLHEGDRRHARFMAGADLVIHDAQYAPHEYPAKRNWGHSSFDYVVDLAATAGVRKLALTHHDPTRQDTDVDSIEREARAMAASRSIDLEVFAAYEGCEIELLPAGSHLTPASAGR
jgi:phosphoribosyl 1,2-cyclic phosphodiesterase